VNLVKKKLKENQKLCVVVKANAYGLGAKKICKTLSGVADYFAVSSVKEFFDIKWLTNKPILLLDPIYENITKVARFGCEFCVSNLSQIELVLKEAKRNKKVVYKIHIKINSGMNRFGFSSIDDIMKVLELSSKTQNIFVFGVFSHFFDAKSSKFAENQLEFVNNIKNIITKKYHLKRTIFHISNSDGLENFCDFDMARIGMKIYDDTMFETIKWTAKVVEIQTLKKGETTGYSRGFVAKKQTKIAVVQVGYADGIMRRIAGRGFVLIHDKFCKILAVCMDSIMVDITGLEVSLYDDVVLLGRDKENQIFICDMASWCDTIGYEIITRISQRVKRKYKSGEICKLLLENIEHESLLALTPKQQDRHLQESKNQSLI